MKNATKYQKKIKKLLSGLRKSAAPPPDNQNPFGVMVEAILAADAPKQAAKALDALKKEYVDFNELRVSPVKEIVDTLGRDFPGARRKADEVTSVLNAIFTSRNNLKIDYVEKMSKRDLRRHLHELGLSPFAAAIMMMRVFGGHAIPVDQGLVDCLENDECIEPDSSIEDVQAFLERVILQKQAHAAHEFFRDYVAKNAKMIARKRKAVAEAEAKVEAAIAQEQAKAEAAAEAKAKKAAEAKAKKTAKVASHKKAPSKKTVKPTGPTKTAKSASAKAGKKAVGKTTKKAAKTTARKTVKKAAKRK